MAERHQGAAVAWHGESRVAEEGGWESFFGEETDVSRPHTRGPDERPLKPCCCETSLTRRLSGYKSLMAVRLGGRS
jgi:hypothetical protein